MTNQHFIIALGGSAGSVEALKDFFDYTPCDHASYVIIRHLPQQYKTQLKGVLERHSQLRIVDMTGTLPVVNNTVYIPPSDKTLVLHEGHLHLLPRTGLNTNRDVDSFFQSLAAQAIGNRAIAVVLSGGGVDGTQGARAIKEAGGLVIAQEPASCVFKFMPRHVIDSGYADHVAIPSQIPAIIHDYVQKVLLMSDERGVVSGESLGQ